MRKIAAKAGNKTYDIVIGEPLAKLPQALKAIVPRGTQIAVVVDAAIEARYGAALAKGLHQAGLKPALYAIPSGERFKTLRQAEKVYRFLARHRLERKSLLIALGGGVIGDLGGFVAGTFLRGIPVVQAPTTLLAQVDSSIGGKTGVDIAEGKNLVGVFHQPRLVWIDPQLLRTLPREHWRNGMAEVIKYGAIADPRLFETLEKNVESLLKDYSTAWVDIIARCAEIKATVVEKDPRETTGIRAILNFGHSLGHAIEGASGYHGYLHGEAVSIGMFAASIISQQQQMMDQVDRIRLGTLITKAGLPIRARSPIPRNKVMEFLARDKKTAAGAVRFVLLEGIGKVRTGQTVSPEVLEVALTTVGL